MEQRWRRRGPWLTRHAGSGSACSTCPPTSQRAFEWSHLRLSLCLGLGLTTAAVPSSSTLLPTSHHAHLHPTPRLGVTTPDTTCIPTHPGCLHHSSPHTTSTATSNHASHLRHTRQQAFLLLVTPPLPPSIANMPDTKAVVAVATSAQPVRSSFTNRPLTSSALSASLVLTACFSVSHLVSRRSPRPPTSLRTRPPTRLQHRLFPKPLLPSSPSTSSEQPIVSPPLTHLLPSFTSLSPRLTSYSSSTSVRRATSVCASWCCRSSCLPACSM